MLEVKVTLSANAGVCTEVGEKRIWVDAQYEEGRQTCMTDHELEEKIEELAPGRYHRG